MSNISIWDLVEQCSSAVKELKNNKIIRSIRPIDSTFVTDVSPYLVLDIYNKCSKNIRLELIKRNRNVSAIDKFGNRYKIAIIYGDRRIQTSVMLKSKEGTEGQDSQLFEYLVICKFDNCCRLEYIYQFDWTTFVLNSKRGGGNSSRWSFSLTDDMRKVAEVKYSLPK